MGVPAPERHDKGIALLPVEFLIADPSRARAAKSMVYDRVRVTMRAAFLAGTKHLHLAIHRRQSRPAAERIRIVQQNSIVGIAGRFSHRCKNLFGVLPGVAIGRAVTTGRRLRRGLRTQGAVGFFRPAFRLAHGLLALVKRVGKTGLIIVQHRPVRAVKPNDRRVAAIDVIVPTPTRCRDQIARFHRQGLAFDDGCRAVALDDEADRAHGVTVRWRKLAGPDHLRAHEQRMGRAQFQFRVLVTDKSTERVFGTDKLRGSIERRANLLPLPKKRPEARLRLAKTGAGIGNRPVADEILLFEFLIELFQRHWVLAYTRNRRLQISDLTRRNLRSEICDAGNGYVYG